MVTREVTGQEMLAEVRREVNVRPGVYRRLIETGRLRPGRADAQVVALLAVRQLLERAKEGEDIRPLLASDGVRVEFEPFGRQGSLL